MTIATEPAASPRVSDELPLLKPYRPPRLRSLDAFRGITIAGMILVNNPGDGSHVYGPMEHAPWDGWTPTDLVFPFFLFIVGVAIPFSMAARRARAGGGSKLPLVLNVLRRFAMLFALGLMLNAIPSRLPSGSDPGNGFFNFAHLRFWGILQRIALAYLPAGLLTVFTMEEHPAAEPRGSRSGGWQVRAWTAAALLALYAALMLSFSAPGSPRGDLSRGGNFASWLDRTLLPNHLYTKNHDPEGLLSTIPAIATALLGTLAGEWLRSRKVPFEKVSGLLAFGVVGILAGYLADQMIMPVNKNLWSPSFVLLTAGLALLFFGFCYWLIDVLGYQKWAWPFYVLGLNPITAFVLAGLVAKLSILVRWHAADGKVVALRTWVYTHLFAFHGSTANTSLAFAAAYVGLFLALLTPLYLRRIVIKI
jgi:predicted acyltransferase